MQFLLESWYCPLNQITLHHYVIAYLGEWRRGTTPLRSLRTGRDSLPSSSSYCPALKNGFALSTRLLPFLVDLKIKTDNAAPSVQFHYRTFYPNTGCSAPVPRIGTLILVGPPLEFLPYHRNDRFPRSTQEPGSGSRYLYAGCRPSSKQAPLGLILESFKTPQF